DVDAGMNEWWLTGDGGDFDRHVSGVTDEATSSVACRFGILHGPPSARVRHRSSKMRSRRLRTPVFHAPSCGHPRRELRAVARCHTVLSVRPTLPGLSIER